MFAAGSGEGRAPRANGIADGETGGGARAVVNVLHMGRWAREALPIVLLDGHHIERSCRRAQVARIDGNAASRDRGR